MTNSTFKKILTGLLNEDESSFGELFNYYYPRLYSFSKSFLKFDEGIDDILQEVFIKIWQQRKKIKDINTFNSLVFTITKNLLLNELRRRLNNQNLREQIRKNSMPQEYLINTNLEYDDLRKKVDEFVNELPERQREIFILSRIEGLSHKEIAEKLGISTKTVEYHISLSLKFLKDRLKDLGILSLLHFILFF